uniref:Uncharacterized protein n=1 Tax=Hyaloperonospora arabidopsidis (strain Emoy2) TaxID=559515 RepID=M4BT42_HYAAE
MAPYNQLNLKRSASRGYVRQVSRTARSRTTWGDQSPPSQASSRRGLRSPRSQSVFPRSSPISTHAVSSAPPPRAKPSPPS